MSDDDSMTSRQQRTYDAVSSEWQTIQRIRSRIGERGLSYDGLWLRLRRLLASGLIEHRFTRRPGGRLSEYRRTTTHRHRPSIEEHW